MLANTIDEDEFYQTQTKLSMARSDKVPTHEAGFPADERDPGVDDGAVFELHRRINGSKSGTYHTFILEEFFNSVLWGFAYVDYGPQPPGNPDVLDPVHRIVIFEKYFLVLRRPPKPGPDVITGLRQSNGRFAEYGRLYRRANRAWI